MKREKNKSTKKQNTNYQQNINLQKSKSFNFLYNIWTLSFLIILIGFFAFSKYITGEYLFFFKDIGSDSINQNYPAIVQKMNLLKEGFFAKWTFYKGMGNPYIINTPSEPYILLRTAIDYIGANINGANYFIYGRFLKIFIFYFLFTGIVSFLYFRTLAINKFASLIGALLITFSGYVVVGSAWGFSTHVFKAMFLLFAFEQLCLKKRWWFFPFAVIWLSSNIYVLYIYSFFLLVYSAFRFFSEKENNFQLYLKLTGKMILLGAVGLMMNFANVTTSFLKMFYSSRVAGSASYTSTLSSGEEIIKHSNLTGTTILRFFSSDILGSGSNFSGWSNYLEAPLFYVGILSLLLFPQIFIHLNKRKKIVFGSFIGIWSLTLVFPYLRYLILAFTGDYFRYGFDFFIPFTLVLFTILSLNELEKSFKLNIKLLIASVLLLLIALFFPYSNIPTENINTNLRKLIVVFILLYASLIFLLSKAKFKNIAKITLLFITVFELSYFSYKSYSDRVPVTKREFNKDKAGYADGSIKAIDYIKSIDKTPFYRTEKDYQSGNSIHGSLNDALAQNYYGTTSYSSFNQLNYVRFLEEVGLIQKGDETATRWITGFRGYPLLQSFGSVKYHLSKSAKPNFLKFGFDSVANISGITILKNRYYLPFGFTYENFISEKDFKNLTSNTISLQSLNNIYTELSRSVEPSKLNLIVDKLKPLVSKNYTSYKSFSESVLKEIGTKNKQHLITIAKYSVNNFKNQIALLNAFVTNKRYKNLQQIISTDSLIVSAQNFNFNIYKTLTDKLKQDTFRITSFKQSEIIGTINLTKPKMLFFTIPYDEGWKITDNGKEAKLEIVNFGFSGIVLNKGKHNLNLYYVPKYYKITNIISIVSAVLFWLFLAFYFYKKLYVNKKRLKSL